MSAREIAKLCPLRGSTLSRCLTLLLIAFCGFAVAGCHTTTFGKPSGKRTSMPPAMKPTDFFDRFTAKPSGPKATKPAGRQQVAQPPLMPPSQPASVTPVSKPAVVPEPSPNPSGVVSNRTPAAHDESVRLRPGLVLDVTVLVSGKKEIEEPGKRISDNSMITLPLLGAVKIKEDDTLDTLSLHLAELYKEYFVHPQAIVDFVRDDNKEGLSPWGNVTVLGRVKKPGKISIPATRDLTLSAAIQQAGGFDTSAKDRAIRITRRLPDGTMNTREVDLHSVGAQGLVEDDILLEPDDVVFVPELVF